ncbi:MAG: hypothetical protein MRY32_05780 [Rickettsiales bacterium]|nr:hypothetical protein [Rickettsiales bacterium]
MTTITYHVATLSDMDGFKRLQEQNLVSLLPLEKQSDGFVTTPFSDEQLAQLIADEGLCVGKDGDKVVAYAASAGWPYFSQWEIFEYMASLIPQFTLNGKQPTAEDSYQYGPICVDTDYRGQGLFENMFYFAREHMAKRYPFALTFINKRNARSYAAHKRIDLIQFVSEFDYGDQSYHVMGFETKDEAQREAS